VSRFHDFRRTNATGLVLEGIDLKTAQTRLGHTDPRVALGIYAQATTEADRPATDRLGERFLPAGTKTADEASPERALEAIPSQRAATKGDPHVVGTVALEPTTSRPEHSRVELLWTSVDDDRGGAWISDDHGCPR
jgi:hypothetical protein